MGLEDSAIMTQVLPKWKQAEMASTSKYKVALLSKKISTITTACVILVPREREDGQKSRTEHRDRCI